MKRKVIIAVLAIMLVANLVACNKSNEVSNETTANANQQQQGDGYTFKAKNLEMKVDGDISAYTKELGEPKEGYYEAKSCAFEGYDKFWYYGAFTLQAYQKDGKDLVYIITLNDDTVKTKEGVKIGDSKEKMESAYGVAKESAGKSVYKSGNTVLSFIVKDDVIQGIEYSLAQ